MDKQQVLDIRQMRRGLHEWQTKVHDATAELQWLESKLGLRNSNDITHNLNSGAALASRQLREAKLWDDEVQAVLGGYDVQ
jgi:hypothetical protein